MQAAFRNLRGCAARRLLFPSFSPYSLILCRHKGGVPAKENKTSSETAPESKAESTASKAFSTEKLPVKFEDISTANFRISDGLYYTPCFKSAYFSDLCDAKVNFKLEVFQQSGSFKERGARNALLLLSESEKKRGVMCASAGNHALAMSFHGQQLGIPVTCVMPTIAPFTKVSKCRKYGANVILHGMNIQEAKEFAMSHPDMEGMRYVNGYDDVEIIAGAGTVGLEIVQQVKDVEIIVVPVGGAGLIAGLALAAKTLNPKVKIIGVEPKNCPSFSEALKHGKPVATDTVPTLADGLAVPTVGSNAFAVGRHYIDEIVQVSEKEIALAVLYLLENEKVVVEGGGVAGVAAMLPGGVLDRPDMKKKRIVIPLCGGNIDTPVLGRVIERGLAADGRLVRFQAIVSDRPGGLAQLTKAIADCGASVKDIVHERAWIEHSVSDTMNYVVCECTGHDHAERLRKHLIKSGFDIEWNKGAGNLGAKPRANV